MVKTPTYPLAAFNYVTLCSFKVYRQITRGHLLCTVVRFLTWSSEISLLKEWSHVPRLRPHTTHLQTLWYNAVQGSPILFCWGRAAGQWFPVFNSVAQLHDLAYKTTSRRVCSCAPWSGGVAIHASHDPVSRGFPWCPMVFDAWFPPLFGSVESWSLDIFRHVWQYRRRWHFRNLHRTTTWTCEVRWMMT